VDKLEPAEMKTHAKEKPPPQTAAVQLIKRASLFLYHFLG
jgi:hypothetical protein